MAPLTLTPDGRLEGIPDPVPPGEQRLEEFFVQVTDSGGKPTPGVADPAVTRSVWIRAEAPWVIDQLIPLLPNDVPMAGREDAVTLVVGSPAFLQLSVSEAWQLVENLVSKSVALMNIYSPNTRRHMEVWQVHELRKSGQQAAFKRYTITVSETDGIRKLAARIDDKGSRSAALLRLATCSGRVANALSLIQAPEPGWGAIYDVLQFVENSPAARKDAGKVRNYIRTANWYRHLGESNRQPLPTDPPSLFQARTFACKLLEEWLEQRLMEFLKGEPGAASKSS